MNKKQNYAIVFDMDETLGNFSQLYRIWNLIKIYLSKSDLDNKYFYSIIDNFPLFLRPNILVLLKNIKQKKLNGLCDYVMIYTNNNGPNEWANLIKSYFHHKLKYNLFDQIIRAFKINGKQIEICRSSHNKSFKDFINCTKLPQNTKVCFIDDQYHKEMEHNNVLYINIEPYFYNIEYQEIANIFYKNNKHLFNKSITNFLNYIKLNTNNHNLNAINKTQTQKNIDLLLTYQIIKEVNTFFKTKPKNFTSKKRDKKNKTQKLI